MSNKNFDEYNNYNRYFNYVYKFHEDIHKFIEENYLLILNRDEFTDFFYFCQKHFIDHQIEKKMVNEHTILSKNTSCQILCQNEEFDEYEISKIEDQENID